MPRRFYMDEELPREEEDDRMAIREERKNSVDTRPIQAEIPIRRQAELKREEDTRSREVREEDTRARETRTREERILKKKKFVRYSEGAKLYSMGRSTFAQLALEAHAVYKINNICLVNTELFEEYLETFRV